jgi:lipoate-protein ligase A
MEFCRKVGIGIVRRPTGGGGVLHDDELTYSISGPMGTGVFPRSVTGIYQRIAAALCKGLKRLEIEAGCGPKGDLAAPGTWTGPCFSRLGRWEIRWQEKKLIGSAQARYGNRFLQHGSIPIGLDRERLCRAFGIDPVGAADIHAASLQDVLGRVPHRPAIRKCLIEGFQEEFGVPCRNGSLNAAEKKLIRGEASAVLPDPAANRVPVAVRGTE